MKQTGQLGFTIQGRNSYWVRKMGRKNTGLTDRFGNPLYTGDFVRALNNKIYLIKFGYYEVEPFCPNCGFEFEMPQDEDIMEHYGFFVEDKDGKIETIAHPEIWATKVNED